MIERSVRDQGRLIARAIDRFLQPAAGGAPPAPAVLRDALHDIAGNDVAVRLLYSPRTTGGRDSFYFVVASPEPSPETLEQTRRELLARGVLDNLTASCEGTPGAPIRYRGASGAQELITFIDTRQTETGCWIIVTSSTTADVTQNPLGVPYWARPEAHSAALVHAALAAVTFSLFVSIWRSLRQFGRVARRIGDRRDAAGSFAAQNQVPELDEVAREFDRMVRALRHSADSIRQAAEDNAHAFKTPIAVIRQSLEPLAKAAPVVDKRAAGAALRIDKALDRLDALVSSSRRMEETTAQLINLPRQRIDPGAIAAEVATGYAGLLERNRIRFDRQLQPGIEIIGDAGLLETVLENLLENAAGLTPGGGRIQVALIRINRERVRLTVEDTGPGVGAGDLDRIFDRYYSRRDEPGRGRQSPDRLPDTGHQGLGLWIVRSNIRAMGGDVWAENGSGGGLRVVIDLPAAPGRP